MDGTTKTHPRNTAQDGVDVLSVVSVGNGKAKANCADDVSHLARHANSAVERDSPSISEKDARVMAKL